MHGFVYIMASKRNGTLYTGITKDLPRRVYEHRVGMGSMFCKRYDVTRLVWFEEFALYRDAIQRETNIKRWKRRWKLELIERMNPDWDDLFEKFMWFTGWPARWPAMGAFTHTPWLGLTRPPSEPPQIVGRTFTVSSLVRE